MTVKPAVQHLQIIKRNDEYGTPQQLFDEACERYQIWPEIDVCASDVNHVLPEYYTKKDDMFTRSLNRDFFMNPPYSKVSKFLEYARKKYEDNNVNVLMLIYAKIDTKWWHNYIEGKSEVHNIQGRLQFLDETGKPKLVWDKKRKKWVKGTAPYPNCWVIWRKRNLDLVS